MANQIRFKRASGSDPSASDLAIGEPGLRTDTAELFFKKDDGSVAKVSGGGGGPDFKYLELRNAANNGAASFPGNDFTLVSAGTTTAVSPAAANTLLVSVSGVIQKPNAGTSTSGITGFIVDGSRFKTATNLAAAPDFIIYQESGGIGEPSDNTVTSAKIVDGAIVNADINASAAIAGTKISPTFTSNVTINNANPKLFLTDSDHNSDFTVGAAGGAFQIRDSTNNSTRFSIGSAGVATFSQNLNANAGLDVTGNITVTGTVDGRDLATDGSKLDGIESGATADQTKSDIDALGIAAATATEATNVTAVANNTTNTTYRVPFLSAATGTSQLQSDNADGMSYNPSTGTLDAVAFSGSGASLTSVNAATLDSLDSTSFLRSDANDTSSGVLTLSRSSSDGINLKIINTTNAGSATIEFSDVTGQSQKGYLQYHHSDSQSNSNDNSFHFDSSESSTAVIIDQTSGNSGFYVGTNEVWHSGNDGAGSGLDADTLDGQQGSYYSNYNNLSNKPTIPTNNNQLTNGAGYITSAPSPANAAFAWSNFDSTNSSIRGSYNVSSMTDLGTGNFRLNFSNNASNNNYALQLTGTQTTSNTAISFMASSSGPNLNSNSYSDGNFSTSSCRFIFGYGPSSVAMDSKLVCCTVHES